MGLTRRLELLAARRLRCYLVEAPASAGVRRAVEASLDSRGWRTAISPAHADALVVAGVVPEQLREPAEVLWSQLPGPRGRLEIESTGEIDHALDQLVTDLTDRARQAQDAADRGDEAQRWIESGDGDSDEGSDAEDHDHDHHDHGDHGGMAPSGIPLAEGAEDRDGLEMDVLVHPWGPLLDRWPGGLELRLTVHGDVVASAEATWWGDASRSDGSVDAWDAVATTLALAGDDRWAARARQVRDGLTGDSGEIDRRLDWLARRGVLPTGAATALARQRREASASSPTAARVDPEQLVLGHDLGDARLLIAAHAPLLARAHAHPDPDPRSTTPSGPSGEGGHGRG